MKLSDYLLREGMTYAAFGELVGSSDEAVRQWAIGGRMPRPAAMQKISALTGGAVSPADFYASDAPLGVERAPARESAA